MPEGWYAVTNRRTGVGSGFVFPEEVFRYIWYWQSFGGGFGYPWYVRTYNVGLEPFTSYPSEGLATAIENGTALRMEAGKRIEASQKAIAYTGANGVEQIKPDGSVVKRTQWMIRRPYRYVFTGLRQRNTTIVSGTRKP